MKEINPLERIQDLCRERNWSYYHLAKASGITYSTLNTMLRHQNMPSLPTLQKICKGLGISLTEFFDPEQNHRDLTPEQSQCLTLFTALSESDRQLALAYLKGLSRKL